MKKTRESERQHRGMDETEKKHAYYIVDFAKSKSKENEIKYYNKRESHLRIKPYALHSVPYNCVVHTHYIPHLGRTNTTAIRQRERQSAKRQLENPSFTSSNTWKSEHRYMANDNEGRSNSDSTVLLCKTNNSKKSGGEVNEHW